MVEIKYPSVSRKKFHILQKLTQKYVPSNIIFYDSETRSSVCFVNKNTIAGKDVRLNQEKLRLGYYQYCIDRKKIKSGFFYNKEDFFNFIEDCTLSLRKTLYVFAHNQGFDFRVSLENNFFESEYDKVVDIISGNHFILIFRNKVTKRKIVFLDSFNYFKCSIEELGSNLGIRKVKIKDFNNVSTNRLKKRCVIDVIILKKTIFRLFDFIIDNDIGAFKYTIAGLSFNCFRYRFMEDIIFIHANEFAHKIERDGYFGGRTECFYIGEINEPIEKYDINSHYPHAMIENEYPVKLVRVLQNPTIDFIKSIKDEYLLIADVLINTNKRYYPKKIDGRVVFPVGEFRTTLCSPELFLNFSDVKRVFSVSIYEKKKIFKDYIDFFYKKRIKYKKMSEKNNIEDIYIYFCKLFMNSLYGKFGQKNNIFERKKEYDKYYLKDGFADVIIKDIRYKIRFSDKKAFINIGDYEYFNGFVAISAFVTSYARVNLLNYMLMNGFKILYIDTDSLFVLKRFAKVYQDIEDKYKLGALKLEETTNSATIRGLKDYVFGDCEKIKGVSLKKSKKLSEDEINKYIEDGKINIGKEKINNIKNNCYVYNRFMGWKEAFRFFNLDGVYIKEEVKVLKREYKKGNVQNDGNVKPVILTRD